MFCIKCGGENQDGAKFCNHCGAPLLEQNDDEQWDDTLSEEKEELSPDTAADDADDMYEEYDPALPAEDAEADDMDFQLNVEGKVPQRKTQGGISKALIAIIAGVVIVAAVVLILMLPAVKGFWKRAFLSPEKLLTTAYCDAVDTALSNINFKNDNASSDAFGANVNAHLQLGDPVISLLSGVMFTDSQSIQAISDIGLNCDASISDGLVNVDYTLGLSNTDILSAQQYIDPQNSQMWLSLPQLQDQALYFEQSQSMSSAGAGLNTNIPKLDIDPALLSSISAKYIQAYFAGFEMIEKSSQAVKLQGLTQRMVVLDASITEVEHYQLMIDIMEQMKDDPDIRTLCEDLQTQYGPDCYDRFKEELDDIIVQMKPFLTSVDPFNAYKLSTYLNLDNKICGINLKYYASNIETEAISFITVINGMDFAQKFVFDDDFVVEGGGSAMDGLNGEYTVWLSKEEIATIEILDVLHKKDEDSGSVKIIPTKKTMERILTAMELDNSVVQASSLIDFIIDANWSFSKDDKKSDISIKAGDSMLVGLSLSFGEQQADTIVLPNNYVNAIDEQELQMWISGIKHTGVSEIFDSLTKAGISEEIVSGLSALIFSLLL